MCVSGSFEFFFCLSCVSLPCKFVIRFLIEKPWNTGVVNSVSFCNVTPNYSSVMKSVWSNGKYHLIFVWICCFFLLQEHWLRKICFFIFRHESSIFLFGWVPRQCRYSLLEYYVVIEFAWQITMGYHNLFHKLLNILCVLRACNVW